MNNQRSYAGLAGLCIAMVIVMSALSCSNDQPDYPPVAQQKPHLDTVNGVELSDPYYWLRERDNPEVIQYLEAENAYTAEVMKDTEQMQEQLFREMRGRIKEDDQSAPVYHGGYYYYVRNEEGKNYSIYCRKKGSLDAEEEVLLDVNVIAEGLEYCKIGIFEVSPNHNLLAYSVDNDGSERYTMYVKDLSSGDLLSDSVKNTSTSAAWAADNEHLFYVTLDEQTRPYQLYRHKLGNNQSTDELVYEENDLAYFLDVGLSKDEKFILIDLSSNITTEVHYLQSIRPYDEFKVIHPRQNGVEYYVEHRDDQFFILTNDNALNFKLMTVPVESPSKDNWREYIAHREDVHLQDVELFADFIVLYERANGLKRIGVIRNPGPNSKEIDYINMPESVYTVYSGENPEFDTDKLRFSYTSLITPKTDYDYIVADDSLVTVKVTEVPGGYDKSEYHTERIWATADDGVRVPISLVYRKDTPLDGTAPLYLYGYGSYGISRNPSFRSYRLSILDRSFVFAYAHVRGGSDLGRQWYESGKLLHKRNTFTDFIACADHLVEQRYTTPDKLICYGGSAGGLLIGAVINMRPELFEVAVADVPFVDVINTMLDTTIPLTVTEFEEWGNPQEPEYFEYIRSYSPYDNVEAKDYPHLLVLAGLNDPRVQYWEPAKWTAKLRATKTDDNRLLLKTNMGSGHFGQTGRYGYLRDIAFEYAFIFDVLGIRI